jgi:D-alanyl-D-alanine carboxypeptidase
LLTHTSGIKNYTALPDASKTLRKEYHADELIGLVRGLPLDFEPGEKWAYCNTGYYLLSMVIEEVSGRPYGEFLTARIFEPLGMATARANHQLEIIPNRATGYRYASNVLWRSEFVTPSQQGGAGVLVGSVLDLVKWDAALYAEQLLPRSVREEMWTATKLNDGKTAPYGYGWRLGQMRGHRFVAHSGRNYGFTSHFLRLLDDDLTVIVLLNAEGDPEAIARGIAARYVRGLTLATVDPKPDPNPALTKRLEQCLTELAGTKDSELLTGGFRKNFGTSRRRHGALVQDLKTKKSFTFVTSDDPPPGNPEITRMVSYRLTTADSARVYTFALTAAGKIAGLQTED